MEGNVKKTTSWGFAFYANLKTKEAAIKLGGGKLVRENELSSDTPFKDKGFRLVLVLPTKAA